MKKILVVILYFISILTFSRGISYNEEFQVNTFSDYSQNSPAISSLSNGGFVICWVSYEQDGSGYGIFAQIYDSTKSKIGNEFLVNTNINGFQWQPASAGNLSGEFIICWASLDQDGSESGIFAQAFKNDGTKIGNEFQVNSYTNNWQLFPSIASLTSGGFIITWESRQQDDNSTGVYGQIYDENRLKVGNEFQINSYSPDSQEKSSVTSLLNGGFVVCWASMHQDGEEEGIFAQIYDGNGNKLGPEFQVNSYILSVQWNPVISRLSNGGFVISWASFYQDGDMQGIYAQIYDESGKIFIPEFQVNTSTNNQQMDPAITEISGNKFLICWSSDHQIKYKFGVYGQLYTNDGEKLGKEFCLYNDKNIGEGRHSKSIKNLLNSEFVVTYESYSTVDYFDNIYAKYFKAEPINHELINFNILFPELDATLCTTTPQFAWNNATQVHINFPWELIYDLYIDTDELFLNPIITYGIQDTTYQIDSLSPGNTYFWKVLAKNISGDSLWSSNINGFYIDPNAMDVENTENSIPDKFELFQNYPNPFNPTTKIRYSIPNVGNENFRSVQLKVYNMLGKEVATLVNKEQPAGSYEVEFDANTLTSGIYFYKLNAGSFVETKKMILLR